MATKDIPPFTLSDQSDLPLWVQLRDRMAYLINSGFYQPGEKLPTVRKYAADLHIAYNTVSKVYMSLERAGYVTPARATGLFVTDPRAFPRDGRPPDLLVEEFVKSCLEEGMAYDDIPKLVSKHIRKMKREHEEK